MIQEWQISPEDYKNRPPTEHERPSMHIEDLEKQVALRLTRPYVKPAPGSPSAHEEGCVCDSIANNNGWGRNGFKGMFIITAGCKIHTLGRI